MSLFVLHEADSPFSTPSPAWPAMAGFLPQIFLGSRPLSICRLLGYFSTRLAFEGDRPGGRCPLS